MKSLSPILLSALVIASVSMSPSALAQSLYDEGTFRPLTSDRKALRVGDVLTIQVVENASAAASAGSGTRRKNSLNAGVSVGNNFHHDASVATGGDFDGGGQTARTGSLQTLISVNVIELLPNGDLRVAGEQLLVINKEQQRIRIEGQVRAQDISDANVVLSSRLAEAKINYVGDGDMSESQRAAWWQKVMAWLGL
ncbi:MAG TPA: flagellar basal body L-ring protein FlgH [Burkholderiaceae bacterium]|jgi:flagellar L-ring protein precursor FlgH